VLREKRASRQTTERVEKAFDQERERWEIWQVIRGFVG